METSFNLIDKPWIGAVTHGGRMTELSLHELLAQAHELKSLHDDSPLVIAAEIRMLLALLHRIYNGPADRRAWGEIWRAGRFDMTKVDEYLGQWHDRFDLFDSQYPFYQTLDIRADDTPKSVSTLLFDVSAGNNATLFNHTTDDTPIHLQPAAAARTVVASQTFSLAGLCNPKLKLSFTDAAAARGISFYVGGNSLFETLMLNLIAYPADRPFPSRPEDAPAWEQDNPFVPDRELPFGYLDYMTWQNRRIRLVSESQGDSIVVREIYVTPGLRLDPTMQDKDPMKHYRIDKDRGHISLRFQENKAVWRDSATLLQLQAEDRQASANLSWIQDLSVGRYAVLNSQNAFRLMALGMASDQAKIAFFRSEYLPLPLEYLTSAETVNQLRRALTVAEQTASELWRAAGTMAYILLAPVEDGDSKPDPDEVRNVRDAMAVDRRFWAQLEPQFRRIMQAIPQDADTALGEWVQWLRFYARDVFKQVCAGLGDDPRALKAVVRGGEQLERGLRKALVIKD